MSEMKHTNIPWKNRKENRTKRIYIVGLGNIPLLWMNENHCKKKANAKFICLAANNHDALVEACKYCRDFLGSGVGQSTHALAMIEAILAKIEKEQGK